MHKIIHKKGVINVLKIYRAYTSWFLLCLQFLFKREHVTGHLKALTFTKIQKHTKMNNSRVAAMIEINDFDVSEDCMMSKFFSNSKMKSTCTA